VPAIALVARRIPRVFAVAAAIIFAAFVASGGIPTLRHDWTWPIDRAAIPSFLSASVDGWLSAGLGTPNPHPTTYLIGPPIAVAMWTFGPLLALAALALVIGYACMRTVAEASLRWSTGWPAALGLGLFVLFNPWVYNEVVAGHLVMVLAYAGLVGLLAEMQRGHEASPVRLALWVALIQAQLQFFILAMLALVAFASVTRKWTPLVYGAIVGLPSMIGLVAERGSLVQTPYGMEWQVNQSVAPFPLLTLGGYFAGYADRLGLVATVAVSVVLALALAGAVAARRDRAARWAFASAVIVYVIILGLHGPIAAPYAWIVRNVPESGVFRELYDLTGVFAALMALLACAAAGRFRPFGFVALAAGLALPVTWAFRPPSDLWVPSTKYPQPVIGAAPFTRVALLPAFQPLGLRGGGGDGADPDAYVHPGHVPALNEYFPTYPVDVALARYEQTGDVEGLRELGVAQIVPRPWLVSRTRGGIGFAAFSLEPQSSLPASTATRDIEHPMPLASECDPPRLVQIGTGLGACNLLFADVPGYAPIHPITAPSDSLDPRSAWIDARLAFAESPALAQPLGGALTQSGVPLAVQPNSWLLAYVRGILLGSDGRLLARSGGAFVWVPPPGVASVHCIGLCELVAQTERLPALPLRQPLARTWPLPFRAIAPWLFVVQRSAVAQRPAQISQAGRSAVLRFNERFDSAWIALSGARALPHVRVDAAVNGWFLEGAVGPIVLVQLTSVFQLFAEILGAFCVLWLLKAVAWAPTKRAP
jgi:hypothetical protein